MAKKKKDDKDPKVHDELKGFKININEFGEIKTSKSIENINEFLNRNVKDKKLEEKKMKEEGEDVTDEIEDSEDDV